MQDIVTASRAREDQGGPSAAPAQSAGILIVDHDISASDSLELMLHALGYSNTRVAYSGHAALAVAAEFRPSMVLLELDLLDMNGYEVGRWLRERGQRYDLRLIALTSSREHPGRERARMAGFERYLLKPVADLDVSALFNVEPIDRFQPADVDAGAAGDRFLS